MNTPIPIVEHREGERRADWHTPADCYKLLDVQAAMDGVNKRLDNGSARMCRIEEKIVENYDLAAQDSKRVEDKLDANTDATGEILEIVQALKGFVKVMAVIGKVVGWAAAIAAPLLTIWYLIADHGTRK
jgi:hypothetical protein